MPRTPSAPPPPPDFLAHIEMLDLSTLRPHPRNDGHHSITEIEHLRASIREHDIYRNVVVAQDGTTLAGHGVLIAAKAEGKTHIPGYRMPYGPDDPRAIRLLVGDNHMARLREQDDAQLAALLSDLAVDGAQALLGTGYDEASMQALLDSVSPGNGLGGGDPEADVEPQIDRAEELREQWGVEVGQLWTLGQHRVICGDCTEKAVIERVMDKDHADVILTDPPYGIALDAATSRLQRSKDGWHNTPKFYAPIIGDERPFDRSTVAVEADEEFWWGADYYIETLPGYGKQGSWLVWDKRVLESLDTMLGSMFELCWSKQHHPRDIIRVRWIGLHGTEQQDIRFRVHPAQKPLQVMTWILQAYSKPHALIFDPFLGSGTTLIACENLQRRCFGCEISPAYVGVCLQRFKDLTGIDPVLIA